MTKSMLYCLLAFCVFELQVTLLYSEPPQSTLDATDVKAPSERVVKTDTPKKDWRDPEDASEVIAQAIASAKVLNIILTSPMEPSTPVKFSIEDKKTLQTIGKAFSITKPASDEISPGLSATLVTVRIDNKFEFMFPWTSNYIFFHKRWAVTPVKSMADDSTEQGKKDEKSPTYASLLSPKAAVALRDAIRPKVKELLGAEYAALPYNFANETLSETYKKLGAGQ